MKATLKFRYLPKVRRSAIVRDSRQSLEVHRPMRRWELFRCSVAWFPHESSVRFHPHSRCRSSSRNCLEMVKLHWALGFKMLIKNSLFCGDPFLSHESIGGLMEYSSSSTSGVAVGTEFPVIDDAVIVGVVIDAWDVVGWPDAISGFSDPPDIADSVSSFSSLRRKKLWQWFN